MQEKIQKFRQGDYYYHFGLYNGQRFVKLTKMANKKPTQQFSIWISSDIQLMYYDFQNDDYIGKKKMIVDKNCILFDILKKLTSETIKDIDGKIVSKIESPIIVNDISSENYFQAKQLASEKLELSFLFIDDKDQIINIINVMEDGRSRIDQRRSNYKEILLNVANECQATLQKHCLNQKDDLQK